MFPAHHAEGHGKDDESRRRVARVIEFLGYMHLYTDLLEATCQSSIFYTPLDTTVVFLLTHLKEETCRYLSILFPRRTRIR